ncbi:MAG: hypothetical protein HPAVJP_3640 [Candidatus Hepatoplasma vulgare]|nr:MAG: hypothetical protein HPAVJP_3640 [Candidatus Hepatoplasma sp.]
MGIFILKIKILLIIKIILKVIYIYIYKSKFIEKNGNEYTYEIKGLNDETSYTFYSLENTKLSINDRTNPIDEEIILEENLGIDSSFYYWYLYSYKNFK